MSEQIYACPTCGETGVAAHPSELLLDPTRAEWKFLLLTSGRRGTVVCAQCCQGHRLSLFNGSIAGKADRAQVLIRLDFWLAVARAGGSVNEKLNEMLRRAVVQASDERT